MSTAEQVIAHRFRKAGLECFTQGLKLYMQAEELDPVKTRRRMEEMIQTLAEAVPAIKDLLTRQNATIDTANAKAATADALQQQLDAANQARDEALAELATANATIAADAPAKADIIALANANLPPDATAPISVADPAMTTFDTKPA